VALKGGAKQKKQTKTKGTNERLRNEVVGSARETRTTTTAAAAAAAAAADATDS
jgi:hypothetical protein